MGHDKALARTALISLTKTDPDPRVRHRAHLLLVLGERATHRLAAEATGTDPK